MSRLWLVAANTFTREVFKKGFIASLLSVPLMIALSLGLIYIVGEAREDRRPVGYVDNAGVIANPLPALWGEEDRPIAMHAYATTDEARAALMADGIQGYYILPADYLQTGQAEVFFKKAMSGAAAARFHDLVRYNLLAQAPDDVALRISAGVSVSVRRPDGSREFATSASLSDVAPLFGILFMALGFMMLIGINPGQPMLAVAEEKENRTMEVVVTSVSPGALMAGKVVGAVAVAGTMVVGWIVLIGLAVLAAVRLAHVWWLQDIHIAMEGILFAAGLYVPLYVTLAALMTAVGATVVDAREAQQTSFVFILPLMLPFYVLEPIIEHPDGALALILSLFPFSSPSVLPVRLFIAPVPAWQVGLSILLSVLAALGAIWLAGRAFRVGMLRYGQRLDWRELVGRTGGVR